MNYVQWNQYPGSTCSLWIEWRHQGLCSLWIPWKWMRMVSWLRQLLNRKLFVAEVASAQWGLGKKWTDSTLKCCNTNWKKRSGYFQTFWNTNTGTKPFCCVFPCEAVTHECSAHCCHAWLYWASYRNHTLFHTEQAKNSENKISKSSKLKEKMPKSSVRLVTWDSLLIAKTKLTKYVDDVDEMR